MPDSFDALAPIFLVIAIGFALRRIRYLPDSMWPVLDHLCWYLLFPLLVIKTLSQSDLAAIPMRHLAGALLLAASLMVVLLLVSRPVLGRMWHVDGPGYTSFFQGTSRWNGFVALAIIKVLYGDPGLVIGALCFAVLVPVLQTANVIVLTLYGKRKEADDGFSMIRLMTQLMRNPALISVFLGLSLNVLDLQPGRVLDTTMNLITGSALGLSLLAVGAGLKPETLVQNSRVIFLSSFLKLLIMPVFIVLACLMLEVQGLPREIAIICGAAPTAGSAYVMARQMGGDAEMISGIITCQTFLAVLTLPIVMYGFSS